MEGEFGQVVRLGVEVAFNRFVDLLADPEPDAAGSRRTYVDLGRGEFHAGRSLDALLAAYRVGARLAWRRFVEAGVEGGLAPDAIYALGEAIFAYIDELSAESAEGYAEEQSVAAGESERRRRRLVRLLAQDPPAGQEAVRTAAAAAGWALPRGGVAALVAATGAGGAPGEAHARLARRAARAPARRGRDRRRGGRRGGRLRARPGRARPPPPAGGRGRGPHRRARPDRRVDARRGRRSGARSPRTGSPPRAASTARTGSSSPTSTSPTCCSPPIPALAADLAASRLAPLADLPEGPRARLRETLAAWLDRPGQVQAVAAALDVHPQTVRYRVRQLRDLFGDRLEDPDARFELSLALRVR